MPVLYSDRLMLRELEQEDYLLFSSVFSNESVMRYAYIDQITDEQEMRDYFTQILHNRASAMRNAYDFAVFCARENHFVGFADLELYYCNQALLYGELGYFLLPEHWGKGYACEITKRLINFGFEDLGLNRLIARCNANNQRSEKVMQKSGMIKEATFAQARLKFGQWNDEHQYRLLREEWNRK